MITVNVAQLMSAISETEAFKMPEMNGGTRYLYDSVYGKLSKNVDVRLSEIDFTAFELDDVAALGKLHENVFERGCYAAAGITSTLQDTAPVCKVVSYV